MATPLSDDAVKQFCAQHAGWALEQGFLARTFEAATFLEGIDFVQRVGKAAEAADHHPDIDIRWRKITLRLRTHDAGDKVTELDTKMAEVATKLFTQH